MTATTAHDLGVIDAFHLRVHQRMVARAGLHNVCSLVCQLDGRLDMDRLRERVKLATRIMPELRWKLARRRALWPTWRPASSVEVAVSRHEVDRVLPGVMDLLAKPLEQLWSVDVLSCGDQDALVFRWFHSLTDARGAARFVKWLGGSDETAPDAEARFRTSDRLLNDLSFKQQLALLRQYAAHIDDLSSEPIVSLDTVTGERDPGISRVLRICWSEEQTRAFDRGVRRRARLADTSVIVWAAARLLDRVMARRGYSAPRQIIPVPMSLEPKNENERMFGNDLTMLMMRLDRDELADESRAIEALARQRREIIKSELDRAAIVAMRFARPLPSRLHHWLLTWKFGGERASQVVSNPGNIAIESVLGCRVLDAYPVPVAVPSPGLQIVSSRHAGRLSVFVIYRDKLMSQGELVAEIEQFERDLSGETSSV